MAFSYTINAGKISYGADSANKDYLQSTYGFSNEALMGLATTATMAAPGKFVAEYGSIFGTNLAVSDGYKFFENENTQHMDTLLDTNTLSYRSDRAISRIEAYKELFLEKFKPAADSDSIVVNSSDMTFEDYKFDWTNSATNATASMTLTKNSVQTLNHDQLLGMQAQLEKEAALLKRELTSDQLAFGGYPKIGYTEADAKVELLNKQVNAAMQQFIKCYDQLFAQYKIDAGGHHNDNETGNVDEKRREQEATTAANMAAMMAMNYAEKYYGQDVKPTVDDYVFGQAPIMFSYTRGDGTRVGYTGASQNYDFTNTLQNYTGEMVSNLDTIFLRATSPTDYVVKNSTTNIAAKANNYSDEVIWDMNDDFDSAAAYYDGSDLSTSYFNKGNITASAPIGYYNGMVPTDQTWIDEIGSTTATYINWIVRDSFGVGGFTKDIQASEYCSESADEAALEIFSAAQKLVDLKMQLEKASVEATINNKVLAEYEARIGAIAALKSINCCMGSDPYEIDIDGQKYIMGQDLNQDGTINDMGEILGLNDTQDNLFESLRKLDTNNDGYVSQEEMQAQKIVLGAVKDGQITGPGYDMSLVKGISLASLSSADGSNNIFGNFTMDLQDKQVNGKLTFENSDYFTKLFGTDADEEDIAENSSFAPIAIPSSTTETASEGTLPSEEIAPEEETTSSTINTSRFSFSFNDASDNKSTIEKLFEDLCWKLGISNVSSSQKYSILDGIDQNTAVDVAEAEIREDLEQFNISA